MMKFCLLWLNLFADLLRFLFLGLRSRSSLAAENLFLRKQLAFYQERRIKPRRISHPTRLTLLWLSRWFDWRSALTVVTPRTFIGWHRKGFQFYWRRKCQAGRPPIPLELQHLIRRMARENPSWGEERIANELLLKLGLRVSPRTIRKYLPKLPAAPGGHPRHDQRWSTFLKNHAAAIIACDFCVVASATFRLFYVLVVMEHASRRIIHLNVTAHPTAAWTLQQLREAIPSDHTYRFILHDHDAIFSPGFDESSRSLDLEDRHNTGAEPAGECALRKTHRDPSAGVPRLDDSVDRGPSATNPVVVAAALQSRPATHFLRTRPSRSAPALPRAGATPAASLRPAQPRRGAPRLERTSP